MHSSFLPTGQWANHEVRHLKYLPLPMALFPSFSSHIPYVQSFLAMWNSFLQYIPCFLASRSTSYYIPFYNVTPHYPQQSSSNPLRISSNVTGNPHIQMDSCNILNLTYIAHQTLPMFASQQVCCLRGTSQCHVTFIWTVFSTLGLNLWFGKLWKPRKHGNELLTMFTT